MLPFGAGRFEGRGHWISQQAEGDFLVRYDITLNYDGAALHAVRREFLRADGSTLYIEETTVQLTPGPRNGVAVVVSGPKGSVNGAGYTFGDWLHYEADIAPGTRLEFTFYTGQGWITAIASSSAAGGVTSWRENLTFVDPFYTAAPQEELP